MEFYNMKAKRKVDVPENEIRKKVFSKDGKQQRHAVVAEAEGTKMFKFVSEQTYR